jgi:lipopolysaccharide export system protein LptC
MASNHVITARTDPQTARAYWTMSRGDAARAFESARKHSRLVRVLRVAIPVLIGFIALAFLLVTFLNPLRMLTKLPINVGDLIVSGTKITMERPHLAGFTSDSRAYEVSADAAAQDLTKPDLVELKNINAKVELQDKTTVRLSAITGVYDSKAETLKLDRDIQLSSSSGYAGHLSEALVDIRKGNVVSNKPVQVKLLQGTLDANRLEIVDSGDVVRFDGGVSMILMLNEASTVKGQGAASEQVKAGAQ